MTSTAPTGTPTLTARTPEDLLAAAAVVLGFWPTESVVMLTFGARHRFHARVDVPDDPLDVVAHTETAEVLVRPAAHHGADRVVLLVYSDRDDRAAASWAALATTFAAAGIAVAVALRVTPERWHPLVGGDPLDRAVGVPLRVEELTAHPFLAHAVLEGRVTHGSRGDLDATLETDAAASAAVAQVADRLATRRLPDPVPVGFALAEGTWVERLVGRHLDAATPATDGEAARLLCAMQSLRVRDAAWAAVTRVRVRAAVPFWSDLVRRSPPSLRAAPAGLLAWTAWQAGDGALAWCALDRCRAVEPGHGLAGLVAEALERAVPPSVWTDGFDWKEGLPQG